MKKRVKKQISIYERLMKMNESICIGYCGLACIDGSCPIANADEYAERGFDVIRDCKYCSHYKGCQDCCSECKEYLNDTEILQNRSTEYYSVDRKNKKSAVRFKR